MLSINPSIDPSIGALSPKVGAKVNLIWAQVRIQRRILHETVDTVKALIESSALGAGVVR